MSTKTKIFIILSGEKDTERAGIGLALANFHQAMGYNVIVFLANDASVWAFNGFNVACNHPCFNEPAKHLENLIESSSAQVFICSTCHKVFHAKSTFGSLRDGIKIGTFKDITLDDSDAMVF